MSISVVIPAYNAAKYLKEAIESALGQTLPPEEVIVVDDGSTDDTFSVAKSFGSAVHVFHRSNHGLADTRNFGIEAATSDWIAFLDADDVWEPTKLERQVQELARHPQADVCYAGHVILQHEGDRIFLSRIHQVPDVKDLRQSLFENVMSFLPSSVLVRRSTLLSVGSFDPNMRCGSEDLKLWLTLLHAGVKFAACREPLFRYRRHGANWVYDMAWFDATMQTYRELVLSHLPKFTGWITLNKFRGQNECEVAYTLRKQGDPRCLSMMAKSILHGPFHEPHRYKVLAHMLYTRLKG